MFKTYKKIPFDYIIKLNMYIYSILNYGYCINIDIKSLNSNDEKIFN